jgi:hypothetical protein
MNFAIGTKVIDSITRLLDLKLSSRKKRRRQKDDGTEITDHGDGMGHMDVEPSLKVITSSNSKSFSNAKMITNDFDDIYGGIVDNVGKYVAVGALDDDQAETTKLSSITPSNHLSAKNIFSDTMDVKDQPPVHAMGAQDLLAPVKAVLRAQSMKEKNVLANAAAALQSQDNKKGNAASRIGDFLSASSSYDFYPDMNNYEVIYRIIFVEQISFSCNINIISFCRWIMIVMMILHQERNHRIQIKIKPRQRIVPLDVLQHVKANFKL